MSTPQYYSLETNFSLIDCQTAFSGLNESQAYYSYYFAKASWNGAKICYFERSYQSPALLYILLKGFYCVNAKDLYEVACKEIGEQETKKLYIYLSAFLDNCGNYKSFGDSKFIPECSINSMRKFWLLTKYWSQHVQQFQKIYSKVQKYIYAYEDPYALLNFSDKNGTTGYYSANIFSHQAEAIKKITIDKGIMSENNRLIKINQNNYVIKIASQISKQQQIQQNGIKIILKYGQFSKILSLVNKYLHQAQKYSANEIQSKMIKQYQQHFKTGDMEKHKQSQRYWIQDKQPAIQTNIGFIQSYLDPLRIRAEFQGFVSVVNKQQSMLLTKLVDNAPQCLKYLPWGSNFEVQVFKKPDFTSLEVLAFASSGVPVGINIPNYDDIRQNLGFKNVNLGNAYGQPTPKSIQYTPENQIDLHLKYHKQSLFVIVALHELLGHGSGRLLTENPLFPNPIDGSQITTFYKPNQTWHSVFGQIASTYQQCRADSVALYLSLFEDVQAILLPTYTQQERWEIVYVAWFDLIVGGLRGMEYFDPVGKKWLQAHIGASFAIFKVLQEQGGVFEIKQTERNGKQYLQIHLNRNQIRTKGKQAIGKFLKHLQVYKSTANSKVGIQYFNKYLQMNQQLLKYREIVLKNKRPRRLTIQPGLEVQNNKIKYIKYPADCFGCIDSGISHFGENVNDIIQQWWENNQEFIY